MSFALLALLAVQAPPFAHTVSPVTRAQLPHSWHSGCPVAPSALRRVRLSYWGFDGQPRTGAPNRIVYDTPDFRPQIRLQIWELRGG